MKPFACRTERNFNTGRPGLWRSCLIRGSIPRIPVPRSTLNRRKFRAVSEASLCCNSDGNAKRWYEGCFERWSSTRIWHCDQRCRKRGFVLLGQNRSSTFFLDASALLFPTATSTSKPSPPAFLDPSLSAWRTFSNRDPPPGILRVVLPRTPNLHGSPKSLSPPVLADVFPFCLGSALGSDRTRHARCCLDRCRRYLRPFLL